MTAALDWLVALVPVLVLLPFSRNDLREVREFRQALRRVGTTDRRKTAGRP